MKDVVSVKPHLGHGGDVFLKFNINPSVTASVKISQNVGISSAVKSQTSCVVSTFTGQNESTVFDW